MKLIVDHITLKCEHSTGIVEFSEAVHSILFPLSLITTSLSIIVFSKSLFQSVYCISLIPAFKFFFTTFWLKFSYVALSEAFLIFWYLFNSWEMVFGFVFRRSFYWFLYFKHVLINNRFIGLFYLRLIFIWCIWWWLMFGRMYDDLRFCSL